MVGTGSARAHRGDEAGVISSSAAMVLLNLGALLPLIIVFSYAQPHLREALRHLPRLQDISIEPKSGPIFFPPGVWRDDSVVLVVLGMFLLPLSLGRWRPGRFEGVGLVVGYVAYLLMSVLAARS